MYIIFIFGIIYIVGIQKFFDGRVREKTRKDRGAHIQHQDQSKSRQRKIGVCIHFITFIKTIFIKKHKQASKSRPNLN